MASPVRLALVSYAKRIFNRAFVDVQVLQFAQTLEHLEAAFYGLGLDTLDEKAFEDAGFEPWVRARFVQIQEHEDIHVEFLAEALGDDSTLPCTYNL